MRREMRTAKPSEHHLYTISTIVILIGIGIELLKGNLTGNTHWQKSVTAAAATLLPLTVYGLWRGYKKCWLEWEDEPLTGSKQYGYISCCSNTQIAIQKTYNQHERLFFSVSSLTLGLALLLAAINDIRNNPVGLSSSASATPYLMSTNLFTSIGCTLMVVGLAFAVACWKNRAAAVQGVDHINPVGPAYGSNL